MILVIDNFDSFTYNLVQYMGMCGAEVEVVRNNALTLDEIRAKRPSGIMLSPGPCTPNESGVCVPLLEAALSQKHEELNVPIFGVCLGMQAIGMVSGAPVIQAKNIRHGKASSVEHDGQGLFAHMPNPFQAIRYHSLVVQRSGLPPGFIVTATATDDGEVMGLRHKDLPIEGVQFHPESVLTENGIQIVRNFVERVG
jgi:anthranilate synthase/aminodeoxychorismate synthase-like glutamine amidotransferase